MTKSEYAAWIAEYRRITPTAGLPVAPLDLSRAAFNSAITHGECEFMFSAPVTEPAAPTYQPGALFRRQAS